MEWKTDYLEKDGIVYIKVSGPADWEQNKRMSEEALEIGRRHGGKGRFLVDGRDLRQGLTFLQVDDMPKMLKQIGVTPEDRTAIVIDPASPMSEMFSFFRDAAFIELLRVRIFSDPDEAIAWLKSDQ